MIILFSEEEKEWIVMEFSNWHIKDDCPKELQVQIQNKLDLLYGKHSSK